MTIATDRDTVARAGIGHQWSLAVEHVIEPENQQVEQVTAQHVADPQIDRADADGRQRHHDLRQRRGDRDEEAPHECFPESGLPSQFCA